MDSLPIPSPQAQFLSQQLVQLIQQKIKKAGGYISFAEFMQMALYAPELGYYNGGAPKFGAKGDFVTAPEISPIFAQTIANQAAQIALLCAGDILELGAGTGKFAVDLLLALQVLHDQGDNVLPNHYYILEVSDYLRQIQRETLQSLLPELLFNKLVWLNTMPTSFIGLIIGNEVLDAISVQLIVKKSHTKEVWFERSVGFEGAFIWCDNPLTSPDIDNHISKLLPTNLSLGYTTEVCPAALGLINSLADCLKQGVILMIDYGFGAAEYYHPQRNMGTLMCHYQHYAHSNPLINVGLQDITAHVDFTAIAETGMAQGLSFAGYCSQAQFLINCGILNLLQLLSDNNLTYLKQTATVQKLLSPAEMGELFKVIAFSKNLDVPLIGFKAGDKSHSL
jgi:SAM-dependent MidA family methyltransferase